MESSSVATKWFNSLDYTLYKFITMTKLEKMQEITNKILKLKQLGPSIESKRTIQNLQQELGKLIEDES
jgi:hypothetical protein